jgi:DNA (cytosine-5)-methyltransferase 1
MKSLSLFAGIGGFDLAAKRCGITTMHAAEIDPTASSVFMRHFPDAELIKDVRNVTADHKAEIVTAGWPCQGNSIAGRRAGMADDRSGLWSEVRRILAACRPQWFLGENVPGLLSVNRGRDFGTVLRDLAHLGYGFAYRVLNAQYFGVPQRRRRVFIVGCFGNWRRAAEVLFESESLPWNSAKGGKAKETIARTLRARANASHRDDSETYVATLTTGSGGGRYDKQPMTVCTLPATDGGVSSGMHPIVTHTLTGNGFDASEDGTGRGTPLVAHTLNAKGGSGRSDYESETFLPIAFSSKDSGNDAGSVAPTLRSMNFDKSHLNGGGQVAVAFAQNTRDEVREMDVVGALSVQPGMKQTSYLKLPSVGVRRLTPLECERLQGFPDGWTEYGHDGKRMSDSARYRMIGNSVAVPCVEWILRRIVI